MSDRYTQRLRSMVEASLAIRRPDGQVPLFGDNDSARILPIDESRPSSQDSLLWLAAGLLGTSPPAAGNPSPEVAWTAGVVAWERAAALPVPQPIAAKALPDGGIWVIRRDPAWLAVRCGNVGQGGTGGHAHNDALAFEYSFEGAPVIVDPGTFVYTAEPEMRNLFRSTRVHSTVAVEGQEINPIVDKNLFQLRQVAWPRCMAFEPDGETPFWEGYHDGWMRLDQQAVHTRRIELTERGGIRVKDRIDGIGRARVDSFLPLAPDIHAALPSEPNRVALTGAVTMELVTPGVGESVSIEGVGIAPRYGSQARSTLIRMSIEAALPLEFEFELRPSPTNSPSTEMIEGR
jgi:hypothetical protein